MKEHEGLMKDSMVQMKELFAMTKSNQPNHYMFVIPFFAMKDMKD
jgi:hypothetical protein